MTSTSEILSLVMTLVESIFHQYTVDIDSWFTNTSFFACSARLSAPTKLCLMKCLQENNNSLEHLRKKLQSRRPTSILGDKQAKDNLLLDVLILRNGHRKLFAYRESVKRISYTRTRPNEKKIVWKNARYFLKFVR